MDTKAAMFLVLYWVIIGLVYGLGFQYLGGVSVSNTGDYNSTISYTGNTTASDVQVHNPSGFASLMQVIAFVFVGIGLPPDTPGFIQIMVAVWQTCVTIFGVITVVGGIDIGKIAGAFGL